MKGSTIGNTIGNTTTKPTKKQQSLAFDRHRRKCVVCRHPDRDAIEEEFIHWRNPYDLARDYKIADYRTLYRHARAAGILLTRRENFHSALDSIVEAAAEARVTGDCVIRAIRAYSCIDRRGRWTELATHVNFTTAQAIRIAQPAAQAPTVIDISESDDADPDEFLGSDELPESDDLSDANPEQEVEQEFDQEVEPSPEPESQPEYRATPPENPPAPSAALIYGDAFRKGCDSLKTLPRAPV